MTFTGTSSSRVEILPAERISFFIIGCYFILFAALVFFREHAVSWAVFATLFSVCFVFVAVGLLCRSRGWHKLGTALVAFGTIFALLFTASPLTHAMLPLWRASIDPSLVEIDKLFGFSWPHILEVTSRYPRFVDAIGYAYNSVAPQFAILIIALGASGRLRDLQEFLLVVSLTSAATIGFWALFPAFGPTTIYDMDFETIYGFTPTVTMDYGRDMVRMAQEGPGHIPPKNAMGLIAVPSFHIVMALVAIRASWNLAWARWPFFFVNLLVLPGTIVHGGHHLIDVFGGAVVTMAGLVVANRLIDNADKISPRGVRRTEDFAPRARATCADPTPLLSSRQTRGGDAHVPGEDILRPDQVRPDGRRAGGL